MSGRSTRGARCCALLAAVALSLAGCGHGTAAAGDPEVETPSPTSWEPCNHVGISVQVLGSGGPIAGPDGRGGSSYLLWVDGAARLMVDMGEGATRAFGISGAKVATLDAVLISHVHADHSGDLVAFAKSASFQKRPRPLTLLGPTGNDRFPPIDELMRSMFGERGAYRYLDALNARADFSFDVHVLDAAEGGALVERAVADDVMVRSLGVKHGPVPALAYRVAVGDRRIVFMGDQTTESAGFAELLRDADLFVAHMAIGRDADARVKALHATPARIGEVAAAARVKHVLLSHLMPRALEDLDGSLQSIRASYRGPLTVAADGMCVPAAGPDTSVTTLDFPSTAPEAEAPSPHLTATGAAPSK